MKRNETMQINSSAVRLESGDPQKIKYLLLILNLNIWRQVDYLEGCNDGAKYAI